MYLMNAIAMLSVMYITHKELVADTPMPIHSPITVSMPSALMNLFIMICLVI